MTVTVDLRISTFLQRLAFAAASIGFIVGAVVLVGGWGLGVEALTVLLPGLPAMVPITAASIILTSLALGLLRPGTPAPLQRWTGRVCAALASLLGAITLAEYAVHAQWLGRLVASLLHSRDASPPPSPQTALCFLLLGLALVLLDVETRRGQRPAQYLALAVAVISWTALIGYGTGASQLHTLPGLPDGIGMALHTCSSLFVLCLGVLGARPAQGFMLTLTGTQAGGAMVRRLLPALVLGPFVLGHLSLTGTRAGLYSPSTAFALVTGLLTFTGLPFIWSAARRLNHAGLALERQREEWTSVVAHDLRQPVSVIALALDALRNDLPGGAPPEQQEPLQWIDTSVSNLRRMIEDLLDASRIEARQLRVERQSVDLAKQVQACVKRMEGQARDRPLRVTAPEEARTLGDPLRIDQVLTNLLSNAVKYGAPQTPIDVELLQQEDELRVSVSNEGPGIPPEELPQLFRRFHRTPGSHKQAAGIGLGLYICKGLVEAHGGRLWANSTPGRRTTFSFSLPVTERAEPQ